jgi:hypothetical protein
MIKSRRRGFLRLGKSVFDGVLLALVAAAALCLGGERAYADPPGDLLESCPNSTECSDHSFFCGSRRCPAWNECQPPSTGCTCKAGITVCFCEC